MSFDKWSLLCTGPFAVEYSEWANCHHLCYDEEALIRPFGLYSLICSHQTTCYCCPLPAKLVTLFRVSVHLLSNQTSSDKREFSVA